MNLIEFPVLRDFMVPDQERVEREEQGQRGGQRGGQQRMLVN